MLLQVSESKVRNLAFYVVVSFAIVTFFEPGIARASDAEAQQLLGDAQSLFQGENTPVGDLAQIMSILDTILERHPSSDIAVKILLREQVGDLDIDEIKRLIAAKRSRPAEAVPSAAATAIPLPQIPGPAEGATPPASPETAIGDTAESTGTAPAASVPALPTFMIPPGQTETAPALPIFPIQPSQTGQTPPQPQPPSRLPAAPATEASEKALSLDKKAIRDLQARLLVLGYDPNGVDGALGRGSRAAIAAWQSASGLAPSGFLDASQLQSLKTTSQAALNQWLKDPKNREMHDPVELVVPLTPSNMSGNWTFTANCGRNSRLPGQRITGIIAINYGGGASFSGSLVNSQGLRAKVDGTLRGRRINANINFGLFFGTSRFSGTINDNARVISGSDSNRCGITIRKR